MTNKTVSRFDRHRHRYEYPAGTVRWFRWSGEGDVRAHRPPPGWEAFADLIEHHPVTGAPLRGSQWWMRESKVGGEAPPPVPDNPRKATP